jgi:hypothetical protein
MVDQTLHKGLHKGQERIKSGEAYFQRTKDRQVVWAMKFLDIALSGSSNESGACPEDCRRTRRSVRYTLQLSVGPLSPAQLCRHLGHVPA